MAAARTNRDLYLSVTGDVSSLQAASKAGRSALLSLGTAANDVHAEVEKAFADLAANAPASARQLERSYTQTFAAIRANARSVLDAPTGGAALQIIDTNATEQSARAAEIQATALRQVATAAAAVADRAGDAAAAERVLAVAAAANATQAEQEAVALRNQANVLGAVRGELQSMGVVQRTVTTRTEQQRQSTIMLGQQLQDFSVQVVSGQSVATAFAQQIGQAAFAVQGMGGKMEAVAGFLTSGWGIAATVGVTVLAPLVAKVLEHNDALADETKKLQDNAEKTAIADQAKQAFLKTEAGAIDDVRALTEEIKKQNDALLTNAERLNIRSKKRLETLADRRTDVADDLASARARRDAATRSSSQGSDVAFERASEEVTDLEAKLKRIDQAISDANAARLETQRDLAAEAAKRAGDPLEQIKRTYEGPDGLIEAAKKQATAEEVTNGVLTRRLILLGRQEKAEVTAAQKRAADAKKTPNNNQIGREIGVAEATKIAASIGGRVTSGYRSTEKQAQLYADKLAGRHAGPVAKPGTSDHERGQAIDIAYGPGISESSIKAAFAKEGVAIKQLLNERDQRVFHVAFGSKGKSQETIDRQADAAEQKRSRDAEAYNQLKLRADEQALDLKRQQVADIAVAADLDVQAVDVERQRLDSALQAGVEQKRWTQAQADAVKTVNLSNAQLKTTAIRNAESQRLLDQQLANQRDELAASASLLQLQGDLATTNKERRRISLALLANEEAAARAAAIRLIGSDDQKDWAKGEAMLGQIDAEHGSKVEQITRQTADSLEAYRQQLKDATDDMDSALQGVAVHAFQGLEDGLAGLIDGTESVGSAFKKMATSIIADLVRIQIQKAIVNAIPGVSGIFGFSKGGEVQSHATGGLISGPGTGTSDDILSWLSNGEFVMTAEATRRYLPMLKAMNDNHLPAFATGGLVGGTVSLPALPSAGAMQAANNNQPMVIYLAVTKGEAFAAEVMSVSGPHTVQILQQAAPGIVEAATASTVATLRNPTL